MWRLGLSLAITNCWEFQLENFNISNALELVKSKLNLFIICYPLSIIRSYYTVYRIYSRISRDILDNFRATIFHFTYTQVNILDVQSYNFWLICAIQVVETILNFIIYFFILKIRLFRLMRWIFLLPPIFKLKKQSKTFNFSCCLVILKTNEDF